MLLFPPTTIFNPGPFALLASSLKPPLSFLISSSSNYSISSVPLSLTLTWLVFFPLSSPFPCSFPLLFLIPLILSHLPLLSSSSSLPLSLSLLLIPFFSFPISFPSPFSSYSLSLLPIPFSFPISFLIPYSLLPFPIPIPIPFASFPSHSLLIAYFFPHPLFLPSLSYSNSYSLSLLPFPFPLMTKYCSHMYRGAMEI